MIYIIRHHRRLEIKVRFIALLIQACCRIVGYDYLFFYEVRNHLLLAALLIIIR
ncbi:putative mitochondrial protein (mitochondrion) [Arabidopsis thaliana]